MAVREKAEVIAAGHICLDVIPTIHAKKDGMGALLVPGKLVDIGPAVVATGGAVSNTGLALHRLGVRTKLMGKVGDDLFGRAIRDVLDRQDEALAASMIEASGETSSYTVVISPPGVDRIFLHCTGANDTLGADDVAPEQLEGARLFHFGYPPLMRRMYEQGGAELAKLLGKAKRAGLTVSLDLAKPDPESDAGRADWRAILAAALTEVDVFLPSLEEVLFMLDRERYEQLTATYGAELLGKVETSLLRRLTDELLGMGAAVVVLKLGEHGLYMRATADAGRLAAMGAAGPIDVEAWRDLELYAPCYAVEVAGTTGAGDCTIAGFLTGLLKGLAPEEALRGAVAVGACNVEMADATSGIPSWETVQQRMAAGWARRPATWEL
jgi:sugar/nucleoside kinase (ribokinase family)